MKVLFVMKQPGDVRLLGSILRLLDERGHRVHLAFQAVKTSESRAALEKLANESRGITFGKAPSTGGSQWNHLARALRVGADYLRYLDPLYTDATKLRENVEKQVSPGVPRLARVAARGGPAGVSALRRALQALERCIPPAAHVERYIAEQDPDVFLVSPLVGVGSSQADFLRAAKRLGVRTGYVLLSWDNLTTKGLLRDVPELVLVWNEIQADEAVQLHGIPRDCIRVAGAWSWDHWFGQRPARTREAFCGEVGLRPDRPIVLYVGSSWWVIRDEVEFVRRWVSTLRSRGGVLADAGILVRSHPMRRDAAWTEAEFEDPQVAVWPRFSEQLLDDATRANFFESIYQAEAVFGINTSAQIEAAIVGRPVHTLLSEEFRETQQGTIHFHYLKDDEFGHLHVAQTLEEHAAQLEASLRGDSDDGRGERFVRHFARPFGPDVGATPLAVDAIEGLAARPRPEPAREPGLAPAARFAMRPLARAASRAAARRQEAKQPTPERELRHIVRRLAREVKGRPVIAGPWLGDEIGELLYWIPFLRWAGAATFGLQERLTVVARASSRHWYRGLGAQLSVAEALDERLGTQDFRRLSSDLVEAMRPVLARQEPAARIQLRLLEFAPLPAAEPPAELDLPEEFVALRFAFGGAFPETDQNAALALAVVGLLAEQGPLLLLDPPQALRGELERHAGSLTLVEASDTELEAAVLSCARGFVGSYGKSVYVAALLGVPAVGLYSAREHLSEDDLRLAASFLGRPPFGGVHALETGGIGLETAARAAELVRQRAGLLAAARS